MNHVSSTYIVQGALGLLLLFSVATWVLILVKGTQQWRLHAQDRRFTQRFWQEPNLAATQELAGWRGAKARLLGTALATLRGSGHTSVHDLEHGWDRQEWLERHLQQQLHTERQHVESGLAVLASIGSTAPFVGLFGTVFGIIHALSAISGSHSASIDVVAGPIGEALVATGIGIAVAIPAVLAYNFFLRRVKTRSAELEHYAADLVAIARKATFRLPADAPSIGLVHDEPVDAKPREAYA